MSGVFRRLTVVFALLCLLTGLTVPFLPVGLHSGVALAETTIFTYTGTGVGNSPPFTVNTSPWKLQYSAGWSGHIGVVLDNNVVLNTSVSAGEVYETFVYGKTGDLYFSVPNAAADDVWTLSVIENPNVLEPPTGMVFQYSGRNEINTPPFTVNTSPWKLQYSVDWSGHFSVWAGTSLAVNTSVSAGEVYETFVYGETGDLHFTVYNTAADGVWTLSVPDAFPPDFLGLVAPANGAIVSDSTPAFDWTDASDHCAVTYTLELDDNPDFSSPAMSKTGLTASAYTSATAEALAEGTYYWRVKAVDGIGNETAWTDAWALTIAPQQPSNVSPADNATATSLTPTLQSSAFSDPVVGHAQASSQWQITAASGDYSSPVLDSQTDSSNLLSILVPSGKLGYSTTYYWHVRYQDNHGNWSDWSAETSFTTLNRLPNQPSNLSPANSSTGIVLTPSLQSSVFSDPDVGNTHAASNWQVTTSPGSYATPVFDSGADTSHLTSIPVPAGMLSANTTYYWHVTHQDNRGSWSDWSAETSFTTGTTISECWAVIIGVSDYQNDDYDLHYPANDALQLYNKVSPIFGQGHTRLLTDSDASKADIESALLDWLAPQEGPEDIVLLFFSGHGGSFFSRNLLCPYDSLETSPANDISYSLFDSWLDALDSERVVVVLDSCESGGYASRLAGQGRVLLAASDASESAWGFSDLDSSVFSYYLLEGLGQTSLLDSNGDRRIAAEEMFQYAEPKVVSYTTEHQTVQHPQLFDGFAGELDLFSLATVTFDVSRDSVPLTIDGTELALSQLPASYTWLVGTSHDVSVPAMVQGGEGTRYIFSSWSDGNTSASRTVTTSEATTLTANYTRQYYLTVATGRGTTGGEGWYDESSEAEISVDGGSAWYRAFGGWTGDSTDKSRIATVMMDAPKVVTSTWKPSLMVWLSGLCGVLLCLAVVAIFGLMVLRSVRNRQPKVVSQATASVTMDSNRDDIDRG
jgi:hypothetical protein